MAIESGYNTDQPIRERGWTHWHHLFNARQIQMLQCILRHGRTTNTWLASLGILNLQSKLCAWHNDGRKGGLQNVFSNQALNTLYNWGSRGLVDLIDYIQLDTKQSSVRQSLTLNATPADKLVERSELWITDPPYADAVNYDEITEFFISWLRKNPPKPFDKWVWDSRRALAVKGSGEDFRCGMVAAYKAMADHMPDNGVQCVMFTHQNTAVWGDLIGIFWAAGLQVVVAWYIATETTSELKKGGYVQGTVILMLKKRAEGERTGFKQRLLPAVRQEVARQIETMMHLNDTVAAHHGEPVWGDSDLQMAGYRREIEFVEIDDDENLAPAALIESPLYREGQQLQPWQQGFLTECLRHQRLYGTVRLLLADEVGLGKTLSLATAALTLCLLSDKDNGPRRPVVIFAPATLTEQWQTEMLDKLGIPTARWDTVGKVWLDADERVLSPAGREQIAHCPLRIGIVSTGLMMRDSLEKQHLLGMRFGVVILDEAHKARTRQGFGKEAGTPNELLAFMREIAARADHVLLGTATPIQTNPADLWDLLGILHQGPGRFVMGHDLAPWHRPDEVLDILAGRVEVETLTHAWELLRSPLPRMESTTEPRARRLFSAIRQDLGLQNGEWQTNRSLAELTEETREILEEELERRIAGATLFQRENPLVRHVVLRKRQQLEDANLLARVGVDVHPEREQATEQRAFDVLFEGKALRTSEDFRQAYGEARAFGKALAKRGKGSGFMKNLMEQRICSSIHAGLSTARRLLKGDTVHEEDEEQEGDVKVETGEEREVLQRLIARLERLEADPKMEAVVHFLDKEQWRDLGVIIFSQYYDTAKWLADALAARYPEEAVGLYAGAGRSRLYQRGDSVSVERETLKRMVAEHQIRVMVATDAACEGLNLQTLGTLINIDLPWNPTRLEQRIGRIKRFGQRRETVDMLNLVFEQTVDEKIYERLSERMKNRYDLFGSLPDTIKDEWIEDIETLGERLDEYINAQKTATGFDLRYTGTMMPPEKDWREFTEVLSRRDLATLMSAAWG